MLSLSNHVKTQMLDFRVKGILYTIFIVGYF